MPVPLQPFCPPFLPPQGTIGLVAPSRWVAPDVLETFKTSVEAKGYRLIVADQVQAREGRLAGSAAQRAEALRAMFLDDRIDAILCARGGTGAMDLLDLIDYEAIKAHPKPFVGYSDETVLVQAIAVQTGLTTFYGPMAGSFMPDRSDSRTEADLWAALSGQGRRVFEGVRTARAGAAQGRLWGGCLTLLHNLLGTKYDAPTEGAILFIEDTGEPLYNIDRMMTHMRLAGKFKGIAAVLVGEMVGLTDDEEPTDTPFGKPVEQIVREHVPPEIPLAFDFPCGHGRYLTTLPVGARVSLTLNANQAVLDVSLWS